MQSINIKCAFLLYNQCSSCYDRLGNRKSTSVLSSIFLLAFFPKFYSDAGCYLTRLYSSCFIAFTVIHKLPSGLN